MRASAFVRLALLALAVYGAAFVVRTEFFPDVVPVAFSEEPQGIWTVQAAFLLLAIEMIASLGFLLVVIAALGAATGSYRGTRARAKEFRRG